MTETSLVLSLLGLRKLFLRTTAIGFVVLIFGGNLWVILGLLGQTMPPALVWCGGAGIFMVALGGFGQLLAWLAALICSKRR